MALTPEEMAALTAQAEAIVAAERRHAEMPARLASQGITLDETGAPDPYIQSSPNPVLDFMAGGTRGALDAVLGVGKGIDNIMFPSHKAKNEALWNEYQTTGDAGPWLPSIPKVETTPGRVGLFAGDAGAKAAMLAPALGLAGGVAAPLIGSGAKVGQVLSKIPYVGKIAGKPIEWASRSTSALARALGEQQGLQVASSAIGGAAGELGAEAGLDRGTTELLAALGVPVAASGPALVRALKEVPVLASNATRYVVGEPLEKIAARMLNNVQSKAGQKLSMTDAATLAGQARKTEPYLTGVAGGNVGGDADALERAIVQGGDNSMAQAVNVLRGLSLIGKDELGRAKQTALDTVLTKAEDIPLSKLPTKYNYQLGGNPIDIDLQAAGKAAPGALLRTGATKNVPVRDPITGRMKNQKVPVTEPSANIGKAAEEERTLAELSATQGDSTAKAALAQAAREQAALHQYMADASPKNKKLLGRFIAAKNALIDYVTSPIGTMTARKMRIFRKGWSSLARTLNTDEAVRAFKIGNAQVARTVPGASEATLNAVGENAMLHRLAQEGARMENAAFVLEKNREAFDAMFGVDAVDDLYKQLASGDNSLLSYYLRAMPGYIGQAAGGGAVTKAAGAIPGLGFSGTVVKKLRDFAGNDKTLAAMALFKKALTDPTTRKILKNTDTTLTDSQLAAKTGEWLGDLAKGLFVVGSNQAGQGLEGEDIAGAIPSLVDEAQADPIVRYTTPEWYKQGKGTEAERDAIFDAWINVGKDKRPTPAATPVNYLEKAKKMAPQIPENILKAVIHTESAGNPKAVSSKGAQGLMQLMPATGAELFKQNKAEMEAKGWKSYDAMNPDMNVALGTKYLQEQYDRFKDWKLALAAYNAGPGAVSRLIKKYGRTYEKIARYLPKETKDYVVKIAKRSDNFNVA